MEPRLKLKYRAASAKGGGGMYYLGKKQKGGHNNNRAATKKPELPKGFREAAQETTRANQRVRVLMPDMKTRFMTLREWEAMDHDQAH